MKITAVILLMCLLCSCEEKIDVDLNSVDKQKVIVANMEVGVDSLLVRISETSDYFSAEDPVGVNGATVTLTENASTPITGMQVAPGLYRVDSVDAVAGREYTLKVNIDGKITTATSYLPSKVAIDSLYFEYDEGFGPVESQFRPYIAFQDPSGTSNFYRVLLYVNGNMNDDLRVLSDELTNGEEREIGFFGADYESGDSLRVELRSIDEGVYNYYNTLGDITGNGGGPPGVAPGNPVTNLQGPVQLGYFGTYNYSSAVGEVP